MMVVSRKKPKKAKAPKAKQKFLDGMEPPSIPAIDSAADNYYETMMERCTLSKEEDEKKTALIEVMKEAGLDRYDPSDGIVVTLTGKTTLKAKRNGEAE